MDIFKKIFGSGENHAAKKYGSIVIQINEKEGLVQKLSDEELKQKTLHFRERLDEGALLEELLPEAFAVAREAAQRTLGQRPFDVQLLGGIVLHHGAIAEMRTGEGKTLVATLPAYLNALKHQVHVVTVNDYLARRDSVWMGQVYHALGLKVACLNSDASYIYDPASKSEVLDVARDTRGSFKVVHEFLREVEKKEAYEADIIYGTNSEFGFDYLRDNLAYDISSVGQKGHHFAIVDEVDSILIDEARTPLIISMPDTEAAGLYQQFSKVVTQLSEGAHYTIDEKRRTVALTEEGINTVEKILGRPGIYEGGNVRLAHHLEQALRAHALFHKDKEYVVRDGQVIIVDEFTGRMLVGRRYSEGLHQAIEAKENVVVQKESRTMATITFQNYFRLYEKLSGMTGTALTSAEEFHKVYKLDVEIIPTHKTVARKDVPDVIYKNENAKWKAIVEEIKVRNKNGQPILCGTTSIQKSEKLSAFLRVEGVLHKVLNAKNHEAEGEVVAQAGALGAVTIATNMAGRGVDIILGGNPPDPDAREKVLQSGGLHVIGTERHEARRIDNQLRGRAGRQGDPGSSQFFLSLEDDIVRIFGGDRIKGLMEKFGLPEDLPITNSFVNRAIEQAQSKIEGHNFDIRKYVLEFDDVMNKQRSFVYRKRQEILRDAVSAPEKIQREIKDLIASQAKLLANTIVSSENPQQTEKEIVDTLKLWTGEDFTQKISDALKNDTVFDSWLQETMISFYEKKEETIDAVALRQIEKQLLLQVIDMLWLEHIEHMEHLRDSVGLRAYGQQDPLVEYKKEGLRLFKQLQEAIGPLVVSNILKVGVQQQEKKASEILPQQKSKVSGEWKDVGRNDLCPCGSGKKFKKCHGK